MFFKKTNVQQLEFNHAYEYFLDHEEVILLCVDEMRQFDENHPVGAQCFPLRVIDSRAKVELDKDYVYYIYSINKFNAEDGTKKLLRQGFDAYCLGSNVDFKGPEEGVNIKNRKGRRRNKGR